jgi:hypothetical protein
VIAVRNKVAGGVRAAAKFRQDSPVIGTGTKNMNLVSAAKVLNEFKRESEWCGFFENLRMGDDTQESAEDEFGHSDAGKALEAGLEPCSDLAMPSRRPVGAA